MFYKAEDPKIKQNKEKRQKLQNDFNSKQIEYRFQHNEKEKAYIDEQKELWEKEVIMN